MNSYQIGLTQLGIGQAQDLPLLMMGPLVGATLVVALADSHSSYLSAFQLYWQKKGFCVSPEIEDLRISA